MKKSDFQKEKLARLQAAKIKKVQFDSDTAASETIEQRIPIEPKTFKEKLANFWYHYKMHTIVAIFLVVCITWITVSAIAADKNDVQVTFVSQASFEGAEQVVQEGMAKFMPDYNKDGNKSIGVVTLSPFFSSLEYSTQMAAMDQAKLLGMISSGDCSIFFVDEESYENLKASDIVFLNLEEIAQSDRISDDRYVLKGSKLSNELGLGQMLDDMYLCIIDYQDALEENKKLAAQYTTELDLMKIMIAMD